MNSTILVVDDDAAVRKAMSMTIGNAGYDIRAESSGESALEALETASESVGCVLLDMRMPGMDGSETLREIHGRFPFVPVVMVTATADIETAVRCMRDGAFHYIVKPAERIVVVETIRKAIHQRDILRANQELREQNERYRHHLEVIVAERTEELRNALSRLQRTNLETVEVLAGTIDAKDPYTRGHCGRVRDVSKRLALALDMGAENVERVEYGALLHDIGKIGVPEAILLKPGPLDDGERTVLERHPDLGERILTPLEFFQPVRSIVRHHHERYDGSGYPDGIAGFEIDILARIVAVADSYDAMTSTRPYRTALSRDEALHRISAGSGTQFDPDVVAAFLNLDPGESDYDAEARRPWGFGLGV